MDRANKVVDKDWNGVEAKATPTPTGWVVEARVAFDAVGVNGAPGSWRFDVRRKQEGSTQAEATWTPAFWYNDSSRFGHLEFAEGLPGPRDGAADPTHSPR